MFAMCVSTTRDVHAVWQNAQCVMQLPIEEKETLNDK